MDQARKRGYVLTKGKIDSTKEVIFHNVEVLELNWLKRKV